MPIFSGCLYFDRKLTITATKMRALGWILGLSDKNIAQLAEVTEFVYNGAWEIKMAIVSASEFQKNFGHFKELAQREPIRVTSNGRESVVLLSAAEYKEFQEYKKSRYVYGGDVTDAFKYDVDAFMNIHGDVLDGLAK